MRFEIVYSVSVEIIKLKSTRTKIYPWDCLDINSHVCLSYERRMSVFMRAFVDLVINLLVSIDLHSLLPFFWSGKQTSHLEENFFFICLKQYKKALLYTFSMVLCLCLHSSQSLNAIDLKKHVCKIMVIQNLRWLLSCFSALFLSFTCTYPFTKATVEA